MITHKKRDWSAHIQVFAERPTTRTLAVLHQQMVIVAFHESYNK